jgi:WD40 repeat protein
MTFSPDGKWLVTNDGEIYAVPSGKIRRRIATMGLPPVAFSPDGRFFASAGTQIWDPVAGKLIHRIKDYSQESLLFTPDSKSLLLGQHVELVRADDRAGRFCNLLVNRWSNMPQMGCCRQASSPS